MRKCKGFTLIELLVVIAIIALLLAIIMPSLQGVKVRAQAVICLSNANNLVKAWMVYANDNNDRLVGPSIDSIDKPDYSWVLYPQDENGSPVSSSDTTMEHEINGIKKGLLYSYLHDHEVYHCPADKRYKEEFQNGTLGWRTFGISAGIGPCSESEITYQGYSPHIKLTSIPLPGTKYVFVEEGERTRGYNMGAWVFKPQNDNPFIDSLGFFHGDSSIMGFADGHGEKHKWTDPDIKELSRTGSVNGTVADSNCRDILFLREAFTYLRMK